MYLGYRMSIIIRYNKLIIKQKWKRISNKKIHPAVCQGKDMFRFLSNFLATALKQAWLSEAVPLPLSRAGGHFCATTGNCRVKCLPGKRGTSLSNKLYVYLFIAQIL